MSVLNMTVLSPMLMVAHMGPWSLALETVGTILNQHELLKPKFQDVSVQALYSAYTHKASANQRLQGSSS